MKLESRPSSEQGLASAANLSGPLITSSPIDIQFPNDHTTDHWTLPDACADGFTAPVDLAREADINGYKSGHILCQGFAKTFDFQVLNAEQVCCVGPEPFNPPARTGREVGKFLGGVFV